MSIMSRAQIAYGGSLNSTYGPTQTHRRGFRIASRQYEDAYRELKSLIEEQLTALKQKLDKAGVPWTSGRKVPRFD